MTKSKSPSDKIKSKHGIKKRRPIKSNQNAKSLTELLTYHHFPPIGLSVLERE
jgi:hypothetical protein